MLIRRQDIGVLLFYYLGYSRTRNLLLRLKHQPVARFVTYHDLPPEVVGQFRAHLHFLRRNTNVVSLDDFLGGRLTSGKMNVVITFDDGYKSWVRVAVPMLLELGLPATFFVSSGFVGLTAEGETEFVRSKLLSQPDDSGKLTGGLGIEDLKQIVQSGFTVGGHTVNHCDLAEQGDEDRLRYEIAEDKRRLEQITGKPVAYFAYPTGKYVNPKIRLADVLKESGYKGAVTTVSGFNRAGTNPFFLHRELTDASMQERVFRARVLGNYDAVRSLKRGMRRVFHQR
jgi:peptidoglycan/xylan/chitin deacetylase (PgdA/CDA1 family)